MIPLFIVVLLATILSTNLDLDIYALIAALFSPPWRSWASPCRASF